MAIPPVYLISGLTGLTVLLLIIRKGLQQPSDDQFIELQETTPELNTAPQPQTAPKPSQKDLPSLVTMYLVPKKPISGSDLLNFFLTRNLQYNNQNIFYLPGPNGEKFFVATLSSPGTFDIKTMTNQTFDGLSFFIQPNQAANPLKDFDELCGLMFEGKELFDAVIQATNKQEISIDALRDLRETIQT